MTALISTLAPAPATFYVCTNPNGEYYHDYIYYYINTNYYFNGQIASGLYCPYFKDENGDGLCDTLKK